MDIRFSWFTVTGVAFVAALSVPATASPGGERAPAIDAMAIQFEVYPSQGVSDPSPGTFEEDLESTVNTARFEIHFPLVQSPPRTMVLAGLEYGFLRFDHKNWIGDEAPYVPQEFHTLRLDLSLRRRLGEAWAMTATLGPGLASDFQKITFDHVNVVGDLLFTRRFSPGFAGGLGVAYRNDFGEPLVLPLVQAVWTPSYSDYTLEVVLPIRLAAWWQYSPTVRLGLVGNVHGDQYRIGEDIPDRKDDILRFSAATLAPTLDLDMGHGGGHFTAAAGLAFARRFELRDAGGDTALHTLDLEPGLFLRAGLTFKR